VEAVWSDACAWPEPPQPAAQLSLLDWVWDESWEVLASLLAEESAELLRLCEAELGGSTNSTGAFALVPVWSAVASERKENSFQGSG
jgi:hypothetical protein